MPKSRLELVDEANGPGPDSSSLKDYLLKDNSQPKVDSEQFINLGDDENVDTQRLLLNNESPRDALVSLPSKLETKSQSLTVSMEEK